jgi:hypothetical protein
MSASRRDPDVYVQTLSDGTATVAKIRLFTDEFQFQGRGSSHRMPGDSNDPELGELLAVKRALENLLDSIDAKTRRLIKSNDKEAAAAENWRSREQWEAMQLLAIEAAMNAHPAGKAMENVHKLPVKTGRVSK